jgi:hypothetical protein
MKIISENSQSITVEIIVLKQLSSLIRLLGGFAGFIGVVSLINEGINIISSILILITLLLYPMMIAKGAVVISKDKLVERRRIWLRTAEIVRDISRYNKIEVLHQLTYAANGGNSKRYSYLVLNKSGGTKLDSLPLDQLFCCYYTKDEINFQKVINFLSSNNLREVSYDEDSSTWFSNK